MTLRSQPSGNLCWLRPAVLFSGDIRCQPDWGSVTRVRSDTEPSRRRLLGCAATVLVSFIAGCASEHRPVSSGRSRSTRTGPLVPGEAGDDIARTLTLAAPDDIALVVAAIASEEVLGRFCSAAGNTHPRLSILANPIRSRSSAHASTLRNALVDVEPAQPRRLQDVPRTEQATRERLLGLITQVEKRRLTDCLASKSGPLARVFASMSASHAASGAELAATSPEVDG